MSTEPTTTEQAPPAWGDPQPPAPKWSGRKTAIAAAVAIVIAAIGGVAIYAGTSSNSSQQGFGGPGGGRGGFPGGMSGRGGTSSDLSLLRDALHGDFTVAQNGSFVTERMQTGEASALSATSVTVKSKDGYTQTYAIDSSTQKANNLANGSTVMVLAKVNGNTATATTITDATQLQQGRPGQNGGGLNGFPGGQNGFPGGQGGMQPPQGGPTN